MQGIANGSPVFQFHKGTIKPLVCKELLTALQCFNSIKVRLNHELRLVTDILESVFQFHKGTIKPH